MGQLIRPGPRRQDHRLAVLHDGAAGGLLGEPARLQPKGAAANDLFQTFYHGSLTAKSTHTHAARRPGCSSQTPRGPTRFLVPETQLINEPAIACQIRALEVFEETAPLADHHQEASAAVVVFKVSAEMIGQRIDPLGEQGDLDPG